MNYIIVDENGNISHVKKLSKEAVQLFEDGYTEIINITDPDIPLEGTLLLGKTDLAWKKINPNHLEVQDEAESV